jgi:uncharacterized protein (TIGR00255 family)
MTGFGRGVADHGGTRATVDIRAVNHRYLDVKLRGAPVAPAIEDALGGRIRAIIERGSVAVTIHVARLDAPSGVRLDTDAAVRAHTALAELAARLEIAGPDLALVLAQPGVVVADGDRADDDRAIMAALDAALAQVATMREGEGAALAAELAARVDELAAHRAVLVELAAGVPQQLQRRLHERMRRLLEDVESRETIDAGRLAQEIAVLADRADVTEELVRLASHLDQARGLVQATGSVGRKFDFLVQEIGRELNTIGAKSTLAEISATIVEAKAVLEKVREQVQNVE